MVVPETEETIALAKPELPLYTTAKWVESRAAVEVYVELTALRATGVPAVMVVPETEETTALAKVVLVFRYPTAKCVESRAAAEMKSEASLLRAVNVPGVMVVQAETVETTALMKVVLSFRYPTAKCVESRAAVEVWIESLSLSATEVPGVMVVPAETVETTALTKVVELFRYPTAKCVESRAATEVWGDPTAFRAVGV